MVDSVETIVLDLGTTAIKAAVYSEHQYFDNIISEAAPEISNDNGHCVSDAMAYLKIVERLLEKCQRKSQTNAKLGLCYQRSSFLLWNRDDGSPVTPLISWQDNRGLLSCQELHSDNLLIKQLTGLPLTAYYFAPKVRVLFQQHPALLQGLLNKTIMIGTLDSFLIWYWTYGKHHVTDTSMAARTLLMDIHSGCWSNSLTDIFNIPQQVLPDIHASNGFNLRLNNGTVLTASVADQSAALLASVANNDSDVLVNLGTGGFVIRYQPKQSKKELSHYLNSVVYLDSHKGKFLSVEGTLNSISAALKPYPFKDCKIEDLAELDDCYCLAEPGGMGAPFFRADIGLEFSQTIDNLSRQQIACLLIEGIIFRVALILEEFNQQAKIHRVYLSGGLSVLSCLQQGIALCSVAPVRKITQEHSSLMGIALLANNQQISESRQSVLISPVNKQHDLINKYQRWKVWLEGLVKQ